MEFISAVVLLVEFCIFLPINLYYRRKGRSLIKGNPPEMDKLSKVLLVIANRVFTYVLWLVAPILILLDLYHPYMSWSTFIIFFPTFHEYFWFQVIGMVIFSTGLIIIILARFVIKERHAKPWEAGKQGSGFANTGIYSRIRHPIYTAVFLYLIGYTIWFQSWLALLCFTFSLLLIKSAIAEEQWLLSRFGNEYKQYMKKTSRFFPKVKNREQ